MRIALAAVLAAWVVVLAGPAIAGPAGARVLGHANLVTSDPGAGEVVPAAPTTITLTFGEPFEPRYSSVDVLDDRGAAVVTRAGAPDPTDPRTMIVPTPGLKDGVYTVDWRTVSATDGHSASGFFTFGVGDVAPPSQGGSVAGGDLHAGHGAGLAVLETESRAIADLGFMLALGLAIAAFLVLGSATPAPAIAYALGLGAFGSITLAFVGAASSSASPIEYALDTRTGLMLIGRVAVASLGVVAVMAALRVGRPRLALVVGGIAGSIGIALIVLAGHAAGLPTMAPLLAAFVHVAAGGIWLGGLAVVAWLALSPAPERPLTEVVPRFSALALVAIALVAATGLYADWLLTGTVVDLGTPYGIALLVKVLIVATALAIGAQNYLDGGHDTGRFGRFDRRVAIEAILAIAILVATGNLASGTPPSTTAGIPIAPAFSSATAADATLALEPGRPGPTRFVVTVPGAPPAVTLVLARTDGGTGESRLPLRHDASRDGGGRSGFVTDGGLLPAGTHWTATVIVADAAGTETGRTRFVFAMGADAVASGQASPVVDVGMVVAIALLLGGLLLGGLAATGRTLPRVDRRVGRISAAIGGAIAVALGVVMLLAGF